MRFRFCFDFVSNDLHCETNHDLICWINKKGEFKACLTTDFSLLLLYLHEVKVPQDLKILQVITSLVLL